MLAGPGSAEQLSSPMSAVHSPEHLASVPVTFGEDGDLAAFACHEQQELAASVSISVPVGTLWKSSLFVFMFLSLPFS